ncbi:DUF3306 domain-containing protein [Aquisalimonas asiatica]|uniref:DUF3306 domain-containing protein n=1 Tax=Aquisalimonas asiatica TaxID=406100 RepID=A0A1H8RL72_9GAMM|nr:DUF3306 domain-containing protein [Aquisalimonas asiatica]SEO67007.1 Protein of unknown function [Aquisalimonas asiatica]
MSEREQQTADTGFFDRWSRRKAGRRQGEVLPDEPEQPQAEAAVDTEEVEEAPVRIDERTGKPYDELTDDDMPPLESLTPDSDVSMFMARNISPELRRKALRTLFRSPKFNKISLCAEYAEDYTTWTPMGDVVPHDWKRAIAREAERARQKLADAMGDDMQAADDGVELADADRTAGGTATGADGHEPTTRTDD